MISALKFTKIDYITAKKQNMLMLLFVVIGFYFAFSDNDILWGVSYINFGAILLSVTPFTLQSQSDIGFINMLPAKCMTRIIGRFLFALSLCSISLIIGLGLVVVFKGLGETIESYTLSTVFILFAISLLFSSIQNTVFYLLGIRNSRQMMSFISMIPAFIFFFGGSYILDSIEDMASFAEYFIRNITIISALIVIATIIIFVLCILISNMVVKRREGTH